MNELTNQLRKRIYHQKKHFLLKVWNPGLHKFFVRYLCLTLKKSLLRNSKLFFGERMYVLLPEIISESIYTYGYFDEIVSWFALDNIREGDTVLDVGAHFGYFALLSSTLVGSNGSVYAFEPTPSTYNVLLKNAKKKKNIRVINAAIDYENSGKELTDYGLRYSAWNTLAKTSRMPNILNNISGRRIEVNTISLDSYLSEREILPDLIKIDAEDYELQVVLSLEQTIGQSRPKIIMECGSNYSVEASKILLKHGYKPYVSESMGQTKSWGDPIDKAAYSYKDILFLPTT